MKDISKVIKLHVDNTQNLFKVPRASFVSTDVFDAEIFRQEERDHEEPTTDANAVERHCDHDRRKGRCRRRGS